VYNGSDENKTKHTTSHKTKMKTRFCGSETGLVTRPNSQTTSSVMMESPISLALVTVGPHVSEETDPCGALSATDMTD